MTWILYRYVPGVVACLGGALLIWSAPSERKIHFTVGATILGLICMEWEYWLVWGVPAFEIPFFSGSMVLTIIALFTGAIGGLCLGFCGLLLFAYVNIRY